MVGLRRNQTSVCANASRSHDVSAHDPTYPCRCLQLHLNLQRHQQVVSQPHPPLPSSEGCGRLIDNQRGSWGVEKREGGPRKWDPGSGRPKQCVAKTGNDICHCPFLLPSPATDACYTQAATTTTSLASKRETEVDLSMVSTPLPPLPPPSHSNASRRWIFYATTCLGGYSSCGIIDDEAV